MQNLRISLIQTDLKWEDKSFNLNHIDKLISGIKESPDIIVLPEMFSTAFSMKPELFSEEAEGETLQWMQARARETDAAIAGSFMVKEKGDYFNRMYFVLPDGAYHYYDKRHLFRMGNEQLHFSAGNKKAIVEYKSWKIQLLICYDLRFPVWAKNNYKDGSYDFDLGILVANWPAVRSHVWKTLNSARAIENQSFWVGVNRVGKDAKGLEHSGDSNIWDAKGFPLIEEPPHSEFVRTITINKKELDDFRNKFTLGLDWDRFNIEIEEE